MRLLIIGQSQKYHIDPLGNLSERPGPSSFEERALIITIENLKHTSNGGFPVVTKHRLDYVGSTRE